MQPTKVEQDFIEDMARNLRVLQLDRPFLRTLRRDYVANMPDFSRAYRIRIDVEELKLGDVPGDFHPGEMLEGAHGEREEVIDLAQVADMQKQANIRTITGALYDRKDPNKKVKMPMGFVDVGESGDSGV